MDALYVSAESKDRPPTEPLRPRQLLRLVRLLGPYRGWLMVGLVFTTIFAGAHTLSIGGVFPVFNVLLEREGVHGWVHRTVAGDRLGGEFARVAEGNASVVRVVKVDRKGELARAGVQPGEELAGADGVSIRDTLQKAAQIEAGAPVPFELVSSAGQEGENRRIELRPAKTDWKLRLLAWSLRWMPDDREDHGDAEAVARQKIKTLSVLLVSLVGLVVVANFFRYAGEVLMSRAVLRAMMDLREQLYDRTLQLPMSYFARQNTADVITRFVQDIQEIQRGLRTLFGKMIREPLRAAFILTMAFAINWRITLVMLVVVPLTLVIFFLVGRSVKKANTKLLQAYGRMIGALTTSLQNLKVVKAYTAERQEGDRLAQIDLHVYEQQYHLAKLEAFISPMVETLAVIAASIGTVWLAGRVLEEQLPFAEFAGLGIVLSVLFDPLRKLSDVYVRVKRSSSGAERIFAVIDHPVERELSAAEIDVGPLTECIEFDRVSFTYPGGMKPALHEVSLTIRKGETVAIVGPNGSGKTTLLSLLPRLYNPTEGAVRYDGLDLRRASLTSLRRQIGLVTQDSIVFEGTPAENITYGAGIEDEPRMLEAARRARAEEFIQQLNGAFAATLGERGTTLSGGQRQRLAIARAIFRNAPILVFDEATSQIDSESEADIQRALREFCRDRTTIIIAHRLSTIQFAARVVVMDDARIVDSGTHAELIERCKLYQALCETQFGPAR